MKMIIRIFILLFMALNVNMGYCATVTRYVNAGSNGGDGTTAALTGVNAAYASLSAWEAAEQTNLVIDGDIHIVNCAGSTADTTAVTIAGWTTGTSNYLQIVGDNTTGVFSTDYYRLVTAGTSITVTCNCDTSSIIFSNLQVNGLECIRFSNYQANTTIKYCVLKSSGNNGVIFINPRGTSYIYNNIIYGASAAGGVGLYIGNNHSTGMLVYNNTVYDCDNGIGFYTAEVGTAKNNLIMNCGSRSFQNGNTPTGSNNATYDGDGDDSPLTAGMVNYTTYADYFVSIIGGSEDFHLKKGSPFIDQGTDLSGTFTTDIDGDVIGIWGIGADYYVAGDGSRNYFYAK